MKEEENHGKRKLGKLAVDAEPRVSRGREGRRGPVVDLFWERHGRHYAVRTGPAASEAKRLARVKPPEGSDETRRLTCDGPAGPLDLFAQIKREGETATWHTEALPSQLKKHPKGADARPNRRLAKSVSCGPGGDGQVVLVSSYPNTANSWNVKAYDQSGPPGR